MSGARRRIPRGVALGHSALVAVVVPFYLVHYTWRNFLWFSDVALLGMAYALWREDRLVASTLAVGTLAFETAWLLDFLLALALGSSPAGITRYMFDRETPLYLRGLSLFHAELPLLLAATVRRLGYDPRAWRHASVGGGALLILTWLLTGPDRNINWVYGPAVVQETLPGPLYLALYVAVLPFLVFRPTHWLLSRPFFRGAGAGEPAAP